MRLLPIATSFAVLTILFAYADPNPHGDPKPRPVTIEKGHILVPAKHGGYLPDAKLKGARLVGHDENGKPLEYRLDSIVAYRDSLVALMLYGFSTRGSSGNWAPACQADRIGRRLGLALPGYFDLTGRYVDDSSFTIACTGGAAGKCILMGYGPWVRAADGTSMRLAFESCMRMVRADYCGDGTPHTRNGTGIEVWDPKGVQKDDTHVPGYSFEASWAPDGAVWLKRTRIKAVSDLDSIARECPDRFRKMSISSDTNTWGPAYLFNRSLPQ
jgi:hypothetical protein